MNYDDKYPAKNTPEEYEAWVKDRYEYRDFVYQQIRSIADNEKRQRMMNIHKTQNYLKGEVLPMVHHLCRRNMTTGDIDVVIYDYYKKVLMFCEQKQKNEQSKKSQDDLYKFLSDVFDAAMTTDRFKAWKMGVYKIIGSPPFDQADVFDYKTNEKTTIERDEMIRFLQIHRTYEQLCELEYESTPTYQGQLQF